MAEKEITIEIKRPEIIILLLFLFAIFIMELQVTFSTPISFGDEGYHTRIAQSIAKESEYPVWLSFRETKLSKKGFTRLPFWNMLEASFLFIFGISESIIKFLTPFIAMLTGIAIYLLVKKIYNEKIGLFASILIVTIPSFVTYSVLFYTDVLMTFLLVMFLFLLMLGLRDGRKSYLIASSVFGALAFLTKTTGIMVYAFALVALLHHLIKARDKLKSFKSYVPMFLILIIIPSSFILRSYYYYGVPMCDLPYGHKFFDISGCDISNFEEKYVFPVRTEKAGTEQSVYSIGILSYLDFVYGNIWFVVFGLFAGLITLFHKMDEVNLLLLVMLLLYLPLFFITTGRAEDTARFALIWAPVICVVSAKYFESVYAFIKKYQKYVALVVIIFVIYFSYQNFAAKLSVMGQVKQFSPLFFEACGWVKENIPKDALMSTVWVHRTVYSCQRNVAALNADMAMSRDVDYVSSVAKQLGITHVFIQKFSIDPNNRHMSEKHDLEFIQLLEDNSNHFKKVYENGPSLQQCLQQGGCDGNIIYEIVY